MISTFALKSVALLTCKPICGCQQFDYYNIENKLLNDKNAVPEVYKDIRCFANIFGTEDGEMELMNCVEPLELKPDSTYY